MMTERAPVAWVNAARMDNDFDGVYLYVEGVSDESFWKKFIDPSSVRICVCYGCENVIETIRLHRQYDIRLFVGVIDRDFRRILGLLPDDREIFLTDDHDIEMMMYHSDAYRNMIVAIDKQGKLESFEKSLGCILTHVLAFSDRIGNVKLASKRRLDILEFNREKNYERVVPNYEKMMDKDGQYVGDDVLARIINAFSMLNHSLKKRTDSEIVAMMQEEMGRGIDSWELSNGHDVSYLFPYVLRRKCKFNRSEINSDFIDTVLMAAYSWEMFQQTQLCKDMCAWGKCAGRNLFRNQASFQ